MSLELKIKSKHLGLEAGVIRHEERKLTKQIEWLRDHQQQQAAEIIMWSRANLATHRKFDVRNENRATFLARAFIAGQAYSTIEKARKAEKEYHFKQLILPRVAAMIIKYDQRHKKFFSAKEDRDKYRNKVLQEVVLPWIENK